MKKLKNLYVFIIVVGAPIFVLYQSCGISKPRYIEYEDEQPTGTTVTGEDGDTTGDAVALFTANIQPVIGSSCGSSSCHGSGVAGSLKFVIGDDANREALKAFSTDPQVIFDKISSPAHGGGNQSAKLPLAVLQEWLTAESSGGGEEASGDPQECPPETIFLAQIQPAIDSVCASCHGNGAGGGLDLFNGNDKASANRAFLYDATGTTDELFNKISLNGKTHDGGNRSADLPKANIELWMAEEEACK
jgi:hypothetical protein